MARVPYLSGPDDTPESAAVWKRLRAERPVPTPNTFRAHANAPRLLDAALSYADALRDRARVDPRLRELAILAVGYAADSEYIVAHHRSHALRAGVTEEQLRAVASFEDSEAFDSRERAVMRLAHASTVDITIDDGLWSELKRELSIPEIVEIAQQIGWFNSAIRMQAILGVELEPEYLGHD